MAEVPHAGEYHGNAEFVALLDREVVLLGSTRLHNVAHASIVGGFHVVWEREEGVGTHHDFTEHLAFQSLKSGFVDELAVFVEEGLGFFEAGDVVADAARLEKERRSFLENQNSQMALLPDVKLLLALKVNGGA